MTTNHTQEHTMRKITIREQVDGGDEQDQIDAEGVSGRAWDRFCATATDL